MGGRYGLLGEHLRHSFSPLLHSLLADYTYQLYEKRPEQLDAFLRGGDFDGLNVTIPYKKTVLPYCAALTPAAERLGNVNTLVRRADGTLLGDNTDYAGFAWLLDRAGVSLAGKKAVVLGTGGAAHTVCAVLQDRGAGAVVMISRSGTENYENLDRHADAAILVNATPVGMYPACDAAPVELAAFPRCEAVFDLIYNPARTRLLQQAEDRGVPAFNGLGMLAAQAKAAAERFLGHAIGDERVALLVDTLEKRTKNLILIGMPGCGKTSLGRRLAQRLGRDWLDLDEEFARQVGMTPGAVIEAQGEAAFRRLEQEILRAAAKESGQVISTGGGVVTVPENRVLLRQNAVVIWIRRPLEQLAVAGRPLSQKTGPEELYRVREPLYRAAADLTVDNTGSMEDAVAAIMKGVGLE